MKLKIDDTYSLIKSLNKSEKGYFKKFARGLDDKEDKSYILLFDILDKLNEYDENKIIKSLDKKNKQVNLPVLKNYLYQQILRFLRSYHDTLDFNTEIRNSINDYEILKNHGLLSQARKVLDKTIEKADLRNSLGYAIITKLHDLDLLVMEQEVQRYVPLSEEIIKRLKTFTNLREIELLYIKIRELFYRNTPFRTPEKFLEYTSLREQVLECKVEDQLTIYALAMYYGCLYSMYILEKDPKKAYEAQLKKYEIISDTVNFKLQNFHYQSTNHFYLICTLFELDDDQQLQKEIDLFIQRDANSQAAIGIKEKYFHEIKLLSYFKKKIYSLHLSDFTEMEEYYLKLPDTDQAKTVVLSKVAIYYFNVKAFSSCQNLLDKLIKNNYPEEEQKTQIFIRILLPLVHFELKNYKLISYMSENHIRHLKNRKILYKAENCILHFLDRINNHMVPGEIDKQFSIHKKEITKIIEDPYEKNAFELFDYISWLDEKITFYHK